MVHHLLGLTELLDPPAPQPGMLEDRVGPPNPPPGVPGDGALPPPAWMPPVLLPEDEFVNVEPEDGAAAEQLLDPRLVWKEEDHPTQPWELVTLGDTEDPDPGHWGATWSGSWMDGALPSEETPPATILTRLTSTPDLNGLIPGAPLMLTEAWSQMHEPPPATNPTNPTLQTAVSFPNWALDSVPVEPAWDPPPLLGEEQPWDWEGDSWHTEDMEAAIRAEEEEAR